MTLPISQPIVLVHRLFGHLRDPMILARFASVEVHAPDLIGYDQQRDRDLDGLTLLDQSHHVAAHIRGIGAPKVHVAGHSVGGAVLHCLLPPPLTGTARQPSCAAKRALHTGVTHTNATAGRRGVGERARLACYSMPSLGVTAARRW